MTIAYFEDIEVGSRYGDEQYTVDRAEMLAFSAKWDPRAIHLDEPAATSAGFRDIIASGAYTTAIFTLLAMRAREAAGGHAMIAALGVENELPHPVYAGDTLDYSAETTEKRISKSRPDAGVVRTRAELTNQDGVLVFRSNNALLIRRDPSSG